MRRLFLIAFVLLLPRISFTQPITGPLKQTKPEAKEYSPAFFRALEKEAGDSIPSLGSFLVWQHNSLVYEGYFHGATSQMAFNIKSATKSIVSALAGIAKDKGLLPDLNTPVLHILPEYAKPLSSSVNVWYATDKAINDSVRATMTLKHLLTMQAGFQWSESGALAGAMISSSDPVRFALDIPYDEYPGETFNYNSGASIILGAALARSVKTDLRSFADSVLFRPAGITLVQWSTDPMGRYIGASEMYMTAQDLVRFGLLYLHNGRVGTKQVVSSSWIKESTAEQTKLDAWDVTPGVNGYGYYWWRRKTNGQQAYIASGYGGQLVCVIPGVDMVIVTTCFLNEKNRGREEIKRLHSLIDKVISASK